MFLLYCDWIVIVFWCNGELLIMLLWINVVICRIFKDVVIFNSCCFFCFFLLFSWVKRKKKVGCNNLLLEWVKVIKVFLMFLLCVCNVCLINLYVFVKECLMLGNDF